MRSALAALAGACALALSACGNSSHDDGTAATTVADRSASVTSVTPPSASSSTETSSPSEYAASQTGSAGAASGGSASQGSAAAGSSSNGSASGHAGSGSSQGGSAPARTGASAPSASTGTASTGTASAPGQASGSASATAGSGGAGTTGGHAYTAASWSQFTSPAGKNWCDMNKTIVGCRLAPSLSAQHGGANYVMLTAEGVQFIAGDPGMDIDGSAERWATSVPGVPVAKKDGYAVLPYGSTVSSGSTTCASSRNGFTCHNAVAGFSVNSQSVTLTGRRVTS